MVTTLTTCGVNESGALLKESMSIRPEAIGKIIRGYFLRGVGGNSAGLAAEQGDAIRDISGSFSLRRLSAPDGMDMTGVSGVFSLNNGSIYATATSSSTSRPTQIVSFISSNVVPTATENRPINKAVNYIIVYE